MIKKVLIVVGFIVVFFAAISLVFYMQDKASGQKETVALQKEVKDEIVVTHAEDMHTYSAENIEEGCVEDDQIFCAVERTVKCTLSPEMKDCQEDVIPAFVLGKTEDADRPTEMAFRFVKIKPIPESDNIFVYTESDCNAMWFGLCKGTVVYSLEPNGKTGEWRVTSVFAQE